jgi:hypothetical protein
MDAGSRFRTAGLLRALDTDRAADRWQLTAYQRMRPAERVAAAMRMSEEARGVSSAGIRARHPTYSEQAVRLALLRLLLGDELFGRAFAGQPLVSP